MNLADFFEALCMLDVNVCFKATIVILNVWLMLMCARKATVNLDVDL